MVLSVWLFQDIPKPTGEVNPVCWVLMMAIVAGAGLVLKWLASKNDALEKRVEEKDKENDRLQEARVEDREKLLAQTNVALNTLMAKKRGESP